MNHSHHVGLSGPPASVLRLGRSGPLPRTLQTELQPSDAGEEGDDHERTRSAIFRPVRVRRITWDGFAAGRSLSSLDVWWM